MSIILVLTSFVSALGSNPGIKYSRSLSDTASEIRYMVPSVCENITTGVYPPLNFTSKEGWLPATVVLYNNMLVNSTIEPSSVDVVISEPNWMNWTISEFQGNATFKYNITVYGFNYQGDGWVWLQKAVVKLDSEISVKDQRPHVNVKVFDLEIKNMTTEVTLGSDIVKDIEANLKKLFEEEAHRVLSSAYEERINQYFENTNYLQKIPGLNMGLSKLWEEVPKINYKEGALCSEDYVTFKFNGTVLPNGISYSDLPKLTPPVEMPDRFKSLGLVGESQLMVSKYTLESYYWALSKAYPHHLIKELPSNFPYILNTDSGYFPELDKVYKSAPMRLNLTFEDPPKIFVVSEQGIMGSVKVFVETLIYDEPIWVYPMMFDIHLSYFLDLYIEDSMLKGDAYYPKVQYIKIKRSDVGQVNTYYLSQLAQDLFEGFVDMHTDVAFFPRLPLDYPIGTKFNNTQFRIMEDYIVVDYDAHFPQLEPLNKLYCS